MITDSMIERFESKFTKGEADDCWEWEATKHGRGYGYFYTSPYYSQRKMDFAHRFSYHLYNGIKPTEKDSVCHKCDNPKCVNPNHLFLGTHTDNMRDMVNKGRNYNPKQKLSEQDIIDILKMRTDGMLLKQIALIFNIDVSHCSRICRKDRNDNRI